MKHTEECLKFQAKLKQEHDAFLQQWPNVCRVCGGAGGIVQHDSVPYGMGSVTYTSTEPCFCIELGYCPRCAELVWDVETESAFSLCPKCGWTPMAKTLPPAGLEEPCHCGMEDMMDNLMGDFYAAFKGEQ